MDAVHYSVLRDNLKSYMNRVTDDYETLIITRNNNKNVVMMSLDQYNNLMENLHLIGNEVNHAVLMKSMKQLEQGRLVNQPVLDIEVD
ncbi:prevent-host-death protein [Solibacillus sp. R5-41]|uniref:type II toxin-antitoxin system Phd/YefM family antitoxin n=1 Tax=Solibacillus sp. R5-41 TaxID=2048654 RepID=UPI000C1265FC|nr:type II toxin-antitoxin system prevent-host-death family antitoxin [Solibacillus sp. R5-41]ATP41094.1 prevent-host-death protein [Solibacillus sp. R5-41]